jgi:hypothetical protein
MSMEIAAKKFENLFAIQIGALNFALFSTCDKNVVESYLKSLHKSKL